MKKRLGIDCIKSDLYRNRFLETLYKQVCKQYVTAFTDGRTSQDYRTERMSALIDRAGINLASVQECVDIYGDALTRNLKLEPTVLDTLQELHFRDVPIVVVSEAPHDAQEQTIAELGLAPYVSTLFTSNQERLSKPDGLWQRVMQDLNLRPDECVVLGDSVRSDIIPAQKLNLLAVLYDPNNQASGQFSTRITEFSQIKE